MTAVSIESASLLRGAPNRLEVPPMTTPSPKPRRKAEQRAESLEQLLDAAARIRPAAHELLAELLSKNSS